MVGTDFDFAKERTGKMRHFCGEKEIYLEYLKQKMQGKEPDMGSDEIYIDPDNTYQNSDCEFYNKLVDVLMKQRKAGDAWSYSLHGYTAGNERPAGIWVEDPASSEPVLYLRSDQFGFSAPKKEGSWDERYPYASFLNLGGEESFVADCVWDTRTLGGSFLWPLIDAARCGKNGESWKVWDSRYNMHRGVGSYMEDSVDLTLYEIKCFYDLTKQHPDWNDEILCEKLTDAGGLLLNYADHMRICKWLRHFQDFKGYVESFCFHPFVNERYEIVDITEAKLTWEDGDGYGFALDVPVLNGESVKDYRASKRIRNIKDAKKLRQVLTNVRSMTVRRTKQMESLVYTDSKAGRDGE